MLFFFFSLSYVIVHIQIHIRDQFGFLVCLKSGALAGVVLPLLVATLSLRMVFYYSVSTPCHTPTPKRIIFTSTLIFHILMKFIITCLFGSSLFTIAEIMNVTRSLKTEKPCKYVCKPKLIRAKLSNQLNLSIHLWGPFINKVVSKSVIFYPPPPSLPR